MSTSEMIKLMKILKIHITLTYIVEIAQIVGNCAQDKRLQEGPAAPTLTLLELQFVSNTQYINYQERSRA